MLFGVILIYTDSFWDFLLMVLIHPEMSIPTVRRQLMMLTIVDLFMC